MLTQGKKEHETVFSDDPVMTAHHWVKQGAQRLHVVDLDGAFSGRLTNLHIIEMIKQRTSVPIQMGGGIRDMEALERVFSCGIDYAIIGTAAIKDPIFLESALKTYGKKIIAAVDVNKGKVTVSGWEHETNLDALDAAIMLMQQGVSTILYTDVEKDGMMEGPNIKGIKHMGENLTIDIIPSGGFSTIDDIHKIRALNLRRIFGIVLGKAIYLGNIKLEEALALC